jgi:hypothetical protein
VAVRQRLVRQRLVRLLLREERVLQRPERHELCW